MLLPILARLFCAAAGYLYPAYASFKAIQRRDERATTPWLMYWVVMASFTVIELFADVLVFWLPLYYEAKIVFVLWLILPQTQGSLYLYQQVIQPALVKHEEEIDEALRQAHAKAVAKSSEWSQEGMRILQRTAAEAVLKVREQALSIAESTIAKSDSSSSSPNRVMSPEPKKSGVAAVVTRFSKKDPSVQGDLYNYSRSPTEPVKRQVTSRPGTPEAAR